MLGDLVTAYLIGVAVCWVPLTVLCVDTQRRAHCELGAPPTAFETVCAVVVASAAALTWVSTLAALAAAALLARRGVRR